MEMPLWSFSNSVSKDRAKQMLSLDSFESVLELLTPATVIDFTWERFEGKTLRDCHRAAFLIKVSSEAYDAFFNSPVGLRAQYAISPIHGEAANRRLLSVFEPRLRSFQRELALPTDQQIHWSLCAPEAKLWIYEKEVEIQLGGSEQEILYSTWAGHSESGVGLLAPYGRMLQVMGGWLNPTDTIVPNSEKSARSSEIHWCGFT